MPKHPRVENGFHVQTSITDEDLVTDKMRSTTEHFENIGDNIDTDKVSMLFKKIPPIFLIQQDIAYFFAFDQLQDKISLIKLLKIKEIVATISAKEKIFY